MNGAHAIATKSVKKKEWTASRNYKNTPLVSEMPLTI
jgi:hypothetical protein